MFWQSVEELEAEKARLRAGAGRDDVMVERVVDSEAMFRQSMEELEAEKASRDAFVACQRLWCVWQGRLARRCAGRRLCAARRSPGSGCNRRRRSRRRPVVVPVQEPLSAVDAKRLEQSLSDNVPGRVPLLMACLVAAVIQPQVAKESSVVAEREECRRPVADVSAAWVEVDALGNKADDGSGVFSEEERRAWREFHEAEVQGDMASGVDVGWQFVRGRSQGVAQQVASSLPVGPAFDAVQDVRLVDCGSRLGGASNRCFEVALLHSFEQNMGSARWDLCMRLQRTCGNDADTSFSDAGLAQRNFEKTVSALKDLRLGVWIVFARDAGTLRRGHAHGKLYVGSPGSKNVGAVAWFKEGHALALQGGKAVRLFLRSLDTLGRCPVSFGGVGAPKKKFRGGDPKAAIEERWRRARGKAKPAAQGSAVQSSDTSVVVGVGVATVVRERHDAVEQERVTVFEGAGDAAEGLDAGVAPQREEEVTSVAAPSEVGVAVGVNAGSFANRDSESDSEMSGSSDGGYEVFGGGSDVSSRSAPPSEGESRVGSCQQLLPLWHGELLGGTKDQHDEKDALRHAPAEGEQAAAALSCSVRQHVERDGG